MTMGAHNAVDQILEPYQAGRSCCIVQGRSLHDLEVGLDGKIQPLIELLRSSALSRHGLVMVQYSRSTGIVCDTSDLNSGDRSAVTKILTDCGIRANTVPKSGGEDSEFISVLRGVLRLGQQTTPHSLREGVPLRFLMIIEYPEHLVPHLNNGTHAPEQIIAIELVQRLSQSLAFRKSQNYSVLWEARSGLMEALIYQSIETITITQPCAAEKETFVKTLEARYPNAAAEEALTNKEIANLAAGTPNRSLESIYLASERTGHLITARDVFRQKQSDIVTLSEGTLEAIDHSQIDSVRLVGSTVAKPKKILARIALGLKNGNPHTPRNIILCGSPSSGKTQIGLSAAASAGVPAFRLICPKSQWVGESERRARAMLGQLRNQGGLGFIDELELQLPMDRNQQTGDSGVTQNLVGQLQSFTADTTLAGKVCLVGTSNRPHAVSAAMMQRWQVIPVLMPLPADYPAIIHAHAKSLNAEFDVSMEDPRFQNAALRFFEAGAAVREAREGLISSMAVLDGPLGIEHIEYASKDIIPGGSRLASIYADYLAIKYCRNNSFFPWWDDERGSPNPNYPYPDYIKEILDSNLLIDQAALQNRINELSPIVNI